jgi:uncharacterized heparinase superfamily protein
MPPVRLTLRAIGDPLASRWRGIRTRLRAGRAWRGTAGAAADIALLPEPFLYGDGDTGRALVGGEWLAFGHRVVLADGMIWNARLPDPRLDVARDTFVWLGDLAACGSRSARQTAQAWTLEWIRRFGRGRGSGWRPERAGHRMLWWLAQARFLAQGLREEDRARLWQSVAVHGRLLAQSWAEAPPAEGQVAALCGATLALALVGDPGVEGAAGDLAALADSLILPGGGVASRAPESLAEIVIFLVWTARVLESVGLSARPAHLHAIARAVPVLRALRLGDGRMPRFHGGGPGEPHRLDQALAELRLAARAKPKLPMGYARLAGGRLVAILDGAAPPMGPGEPRGAASTLAFELTAGRQPLVVNAGPGHLFGPAAAAASRATAAHSTVELDGASSARFCRPGAAARAFGVWIEGGPSHVSVRQAQDHTGQWLLATHDGYVETLGLLHERRLFVDARGIECRGEEIIYVTDGRAQRVHDAAVRRRGGPIPIVARFHLHPDVAAATDPVRQIVEIMPPGLDTWIFRCAGGRVELRDSRHFDPKAAEPVTGLQIMVIAEVIDYLGQITWSFTRAAPRAAEGEGPGPATA